MKQNAIHWLIGGGAWWLGSCIARSLPAPVPMGSRGYLFFYNFVQNLVANFELKK